MITTTVIHGLDGKKTTDSSPSGITVGGAKRDEELLKMLRVLVNMGDNRRCFDCTQPGPTYINITIGAYVCTACSGRLRGLTPPHRLKSITMASFTGEEMEFLKSRGNEFCHRVWLARRLGTLLPGESVTNYDADKMAAHLCDKYERQLWYQAPTEALYEEARHQSAVVLEAMRDATGSRGGQRGLIGPAGIAVRQSNTMPDLHKQQNQQSMTLSPCITGSVQRNTPILSTVKRPPHHSLPPRPLLPAAAYNGGGVTHTGGCNGGGATPPDSTWMMSQGHFSSTPSSPWMLTSGSPWGASPSHTAVSPWGAAPPNTAVSPWIPTTPPATTNTSTSAFNAMEVNDPHSELANFANFPAAQRQLLPLASLSCPSANQASPFATEERRLVPPVPSDKYAALSDFTDRNAPPIINWSGSSTSHPPAQPSVNNQSTCSGQFVQNFNGCHGNAFNGNNGTNVHDASHCLQYNQQLNPFMNGSLQHMNTSHNPFLS